LDLNELLVRCPGESDSALATLLSFEDEASTLVKVYSTCRAISAANGTFENIVIPVGVNRRGVGIIETERGAKLSQEQGVVRAFSPSSIFRPTTYKPVQTPFPILILALRQIVDDDHHTDQKVAAFDSRIRDSTITEGHRASE
jgi:hypothetical protein